MMTVAILCPRCKGKRIYTHNADQLQCQGCGHVFDAPHIITCPHCNVNILLVEDGEPTATPEPEAKSTRPEFIANDPEMCGSCVRGMPWIPNVSSDCVNGDKYKPSGVSARCTEWRGE